MDGNVPDLPEPTSAPAPVTVAEKKLAARRKKTPEPFLTIEDKVHKPHSEHDHSEPPPPAPPKHFEFDLRQAVIQSSILERPYK